MRNFIDSLFNVPENLLNFVLEKLNGAATIVGKGINVGNYFGWIGILGPEWTSVINSLLSSFSLILIVWVCQKIYRLYLTFKDGIKWW